MTTATTPRPIFIIGSPRSGTSVFTWAVGQHPNLLPIEETSWLARAATDLGVAYSIGSARGERSHLSAAGISRAEMFELSGRAFNELVVRGGERAEIGEADDAFAVRRAATDPKRRWVDGTPENSFAVYGIHLLFPEARFVHLVRDVRAVVRSLVNFSNAGGQDMAPTEAWQKWFDCVSSAHNAERALGSNVVLRLRHQELVDDPEGTLERCMAHVGEELHPDCLRPLGDRINSSNVAPTFDVDALDVEPELRVKADGLCAEVLDRDLTYAPDADVLDRMASDFAQRVRFTENLAGDRLRALEALRRVEREKAEAQRWALSLRGELEALRSRATAVDGVSSQPTG